MLQSRDSGSLHFGVSVTAQGHGRADRGLLWSERDTLYWPPFDGLV